MGIRARERTRASGRLLATLLSAVAACAPSGGGVGKAPTDDDEWSTLDSFHDARAIVARGLEALGGAGALERAGGVSLEGEGILDLGTLLQGRRPFEADRYTVHENVAVLPAADRVVHERREPLNPDASQWVRNDFRSTGTYRIDMQTGRATWTPPVDPSHVARLVPHLLLAEVLARPSGLRHLGDVIVAGSVREAVTWSAPGRGLVTLLFEPSSGHLREIESVGDLPVRGDALVRLTFYEYNDVPGLGAFPTGYRIEVDGELLQNVRWARRATAPVGGILDPPEGVTLPEPLPFPETEPGEAFDIRELDPGVHLLVNLRTGFHMLFVELEEWVVAVDAASGWWELHEVPPSNWAESGSLTLGERYVAAIRSRVGDKPIRYVVLTHHHSDHAGGVRAFVEAGATVLGAHVTRAVVERTLAGSLALAGRSESAPPAWRFESVAGERTLTDGAREVRVIDVGPNPHAEGMLAVWLPGSRILYVSDLFDPWSTRRAPAAERLPVMRWFVDWLDRSGLEPARIYAIHGAGLVSEQNLSEMRRSADTPQPSGPVEVPGTSRPVPDAEPSAVDMLVSSRNDDTVKRFDGRTGAFLGQPDRPSALRWITCGTTMAASTWSASARATCGGSTARAG